MAKNSRDKALVALLESPSIRKAAELSGLSESSLYRFLRDQDFLKEFRSRRRDLMETTIGRLQEASAQAAHTLRKNLTCGQPAVETRSASLILEMAIKGVEVTEILERLEALENESANKN